jgi:adenylate kinase
VQKHALGIVPARVALTGTPGTGKSRVARELGRGRSVAEVGDLAVERGFASHRHGQLLVDLPGLRRSLTSSPPERETILVGHLAHLLPVDRAIVLRCHPLILRARLERIGRGTVDECQENLVAEAIDLVAREARDRGLPVWEIDTTHRTPRSVAREVERTLRRGSMGPGPPIDWLADPRVTAHLLDRAS